MSNNGRNALVLAGGAAAGSFQVGMLDVLVNECGLDFQIIRGVSVGALNGAFLAQAPAENTSLANLKKSVTELKRIWTTEVEGNDSIYTDRNPYLSGQDNEEDRRLAKLAWRGEHSFFDNKPLFRMMIEHLDVKRMCESQRDFAIGVVDLLEGAFLTRTPESNSLFLEDILASTAIPGVFPPVARTHPYGSTAQSEILLDGGVREVTPLSSVLRATPPPDQVYVLMTRPIISIGPPNRLMDNTLLPLDALDWHTGFSGMEVLFRVVEILKDEVYIDDIRRSREWHSILKCATDLCEKAKKYSDDLGDRARQLECAIANTSFLDKDTVSIHIIAPQEKYEENETSALMQGVNFSPDLIKKAIDHGACIASDKTKWFSID